MRQATLVCGQLVHIIMKPQVKKTSPAIRAALRRTPRRPRKSVIPTRTMRSSVSLAHAGANHSGITQYGHDTGLSIEWFGNDASGAPPTSYGAQVNQLPLRTPSTVAAIPGR